MRDRTNLAEKFAQLPDAYQPAIVRYVNYYKLVIIRTGRVRLAHARRDRRAVPGGRATVDDPVPRPRRRARAGRIVRPSGAASNTSRRPNEEAHVLLVEPPGQGTVSATRTVRR